MMHLPVMISMLFSTLTSTSVGNWNEKMLSPTKMALNIEESLNRNQTVSNLQRQERQLASDRPNPSNPSNSSGFKGTHVNTSFLSVPDDVPRYQATLRKPVFSQRKPLSVFSPSDETSVSERSETSPPFVRYSHKRHSSPGRGRVPFRFINRHLHPHTTSNIRKTLYPPLSGEDNPYRSSVHAKIILQPPRYTNTYPTYTGRNRLGYSTQSTVKTPTIHNKSSSTFSGNGGFFLMRKIKPQPILNQKQLPSNGSTKVFSKSKHVTSQNNNKNTSYSRSNETLTSHFISGPVLPQPHLNNLTPTLSTPPSGSLDPSRVFLQPHYPIGDPNIFNTSTKGKYDSNYQDTSISANHLKTLANIDGRSSFLSDTILSNTHNSENFPTSSLTRKVIPIVYQSPANSIVEDSSSLEEQSLQQGDTSNLSSFWGHTGFPTRKPTNIGREPKPPKVRPTEVFRTNLTCDCILPFLTSLDCVLKISPKRQMERRHRHMCCFDCTEDDLWSRWCPEGTEIDYNVVHTQRTIERNTPHHCKYLDKHTVRQEIDKFHTKESPKYQCYEQLDEMCPNKIQPTVPPTVNPAQKLIRDAKLSRQIDEQLRKDYMSFKHRRVYHKHTRKTSTAPPISFDFEPMKPRRFSGR